MKVVPVLEVGGTHVTAALVDTSAWRVAPGSVVRRDLDAAAPSQEIVAVLGSTGRRVHPDPAAQWCVAIPGPFDYQAGVAWFAGVGKFDALYGLDLGRALLRALRTEAVHFVKDAEAFTIGEWLVGAARDCRRAVGVTLGTGVGSAWLVDGSAVREGPGVPPEGRLDLLEVDGAPLEQSVSRRAILARYATLAGEAAAGVDVVDVAERARSGEAAALRTLHETLSMLGGVLAPRAAAFDADVVVVGGSIASSWDVVGPPLVAAVAGVTTSSGRVVRLVPAEGGADAALVGAARAAVPGEGGGTV